MREFLEILGIEFFVLSGLAIFVVGLIKLLSVLDEEKSYERYHGDFYKDKRYYVRPTDDPNILWGYVDTGEGWDGPYRITKRHVLPDWVND